MTPAPVRRRVAARYRPGGRFAFHYVAGKLRMDPLAGALLDMGGREGFGRVADIGCGRGQFAALLLEAGLACAIVGVDGDAAMLAQARAAMRDLPFEGRLQDLAADPSVPEADTVAVLDVLYQLPTEAQAALLDGAARSAGRMVLVRTADPSRSLRALLTRTLERAGRGVWPHTGAAFNARPVDWIADRLAAAGLTVEAAPCSAGTPFANVLLTARRRPPAR